MCVCMCCMCGYWILWFMCGMICICSLISRAQMSFHEALYFMLTTLSTVGSYVYVFCVCVVCVCYVCVRCERMCETNHPYITIGIPTQKHTDTSHTKTHTRHAHTHQIHLRHTHIITLTITEHTHNGNLYKIITCKYSFIQQNVTDKT